MPLGQFVDLRVEVDGDHVQIFDPRRRALPYEIIKYSVMAGPGEGEERHSGVWIAQDRHAEFQLVHDPLPLAGVIPVIADAACLTFIGAVRLRRSCSEKLADVAKRCPSGAKPQISTRNHMKLAIRGLFQGDVELDVQCNVECIRTCIAEDGTEVARYSEFLGVV